MIQKDKSIYVQFLALDLLKEDLSELSTEAALCLLMRLKEHPSISDVKFSLAQGVVENIESKSFEDIMNLRSQGGLYDGFGATVKDRCE